MYAIINGQTAMAHWLIEHLGQHNIGTRDREGKAALHCACSNGSLSVVQALAAAGADASLVDKDGWTPLICACLNNKYDIVPYLLQVPLVRATIDTVTNANTWGALSWTASTGHLPMVQLLLDAGADPTIPTNYNYSPLSCAPRNGHTNTAALLRRAIAEPDRARALYKARALLDAAIAIPKARKNARDEGKSPAEQQQKAVAAAPIYLKARVGRDEALPEVALKSMRARPCKWKEPVRAAVAFAVGLEEDGVVYPGLPREVYEQLLDYMVPTWADKGPHA